jgi:hypothetical protein
MQSFHYIIALGYVANDSFGILVLFGAFVNIYHETCLGQSIIAWSQVVVIIDMSGTLFTSITMVGSCDG